MSAAINVIGQSREELTSLLEGVRRERLLDLIYELASIEPHYSPRSVARARELSPRRIVELCKAGEMPGAHKPMANGWRISRSGLRLWDERTRVTPLV